MPNVAIRVDAKEYDSSLHYITRCVSIATELSSRFSNVYFFTKYEPGATTIKNSFFNAIKISNEDDVLESGNREKIKRVTSFGEDIEEIKHYIEKFDINAIIIDKQDATKEYFDEYRSLTRRLVHIDDVNKFKSPANVIINGNFNVDDDDYEEIEGQKLFLGLEYCLVDDEIIALPEKKIRKYVNDIFISVCDNDSSKLLPVILDILAKDEELKSVRFHMVVTNKCATLPQLQEISNKNPNVILHIDLPKINSLLEKCDAAISDDPSHIYQIIASRTPSLSFVTRDDDFDFFEKMWFTKASSKIGEAHNLDRYLLKKVHAMIESEVGRKKMSDRCKSLVDGGAALRIIDETWNFFIKGRN